MAYDEDEFDPDEADLDDSEEIDDNDLDVGGEDSETVPCPRCGKPVYEHADRCPHCGQQIVADGPRPLRWFVILAVILCVVGMILLLLRW